MAQNIHLKDRVRFFPTTKKKDLPPMFDSKFVSTVVLNPEIQLPISFDEWQGGMFNFNELIGTSGSGLISQIDLGAFNTGTAETGSNFLQVINGSGTFGNEYPLYYGSNTISGKHSGYLFYTVYDVESSIVYDSANERIYKIFKVCVDIWESKILINDVTDYNDIK
jgi:hypothetical protein